MAAALVDGQIFVIEMPVDAEEENRHQILVECVGMTVIFERSAVVTLNDVFGFSGWHRIVLIQDRDAACVVPLAAFQGVSEGDALDISVDQGSAAADVVFGDGQGFQSRSDQPRQNQNQNQQDKEPLPVTLRPGSAFKFSGVGLLILLAHR